MADTFDHIAIAVKDLEKALNFYKDAFGLLPERVETYEAIKTRIAYIPAGPVEIHLLSPMEVGAGPVGPFIESNGGGLHHMGLKVGDIEKTVGNLRDLNIGIRGNAIVDVKAGLRVAMTEPAFTLNVPIELVERKE